MTSFFAFLKKEWMQQVRSGRLVLLGLLFLAFGIMNPAMAKLTPWLMDILSESLESSGITVTPVPITAMDSWVQFYKNLPLCLIFFILAESSIFTKEYQTGTLVLSLTRGLSRHQIVTAKTSVLVVLWTVGYWLCFAVTYGYNAYFWDNSIAAHLLFAAGCWWLFGLWIVLMVVFFSVWAQDNTIVLAGTGSIVLAVWLLGFLPRLSKLVPTHLTDGMALLLQQAEPKEYLSALLITVVLSVLCFVIAFPLFAKKDI